jgi:hypothetical protein
MIKNWENRLLLDTMYLFFPRTINDLRRNAVIEEIAAEELN